MTANHVDKKRLDEILKEYEGREGFLIQLLLDLQEAFSWLPKDVLQQVSLKLKIPMSQIFRVASFYKAMSLQPVGRHRVSVCMGTACQVRGAQRLLDATELALGAKQGETTSDGNFTLNRVNCLGCCAIGPVVVIDEAYLGRADGKKIDLILEKALHEPDTSQRYHSNKAESDTIQ